MITQTSEGSNYSHSLKQYLHTAHQHDSMKKRLKVLHIMENKSQGKLKEHQFVLEKVQQAQEEREFKRTQKSEHMKRETFNQKELKGKNQEARRNMKDRLSQAFRQIQNMKEEDHNMIKANSQKIADKIKKSREKDFREKKNRKQQIAMKEEEAKDNYLKYFTHRKEELSEQKKLQNSRLAEKQEDKSKELKEMNQIQSQLLEKQSQTRVQVNLLNERLFKNYGNLSKISKKKNYGFKDSSATNLVTEDCNDE